MWKRTFFKALVMIILCLLFESLIFKLSEYVLALEFNKPSFSTSEVVESEDVEYQENKQSTFSTDENTEVSIQSPKLIGEICEKVATIQETEPTSQYITQTETKMTEEPYTYTEKFPEVPFVFQSDYPDVRYGDGTVASGGCGIACLSMVLTYLLDKEVMPNELAKKYGHFKVEDGSSWTLFSTSATDYNVEIIEQLYNWNDGIEDALKDGHVVIANIHSPSVFTGGGHFIVLYGITEDGKILVRDPNKSNYSEHGNPILKDGFKNGFDSKQISCFCSSYWVYQQKDLNSIANLAKADGALG